MHSPCGDFKSLGHSSYSIILALSGVMIKPLWPHKSVLLHAEERIRVQGVALYGDAGCLLLGTFS